jgi:hypothetical protein
MPVAPREVVFTPRETRGVGARIRYVVGLLLGLAAIFLLTVGRGSERLAGGGMVAAAIGGACLLGAIAVIAWDR